MCMWCFARSGQLDEDADVQKNWFMARDAEPSGLPAVEVTLGEQATAVVPGLSVAAVPVDEDAASLTDFAGVIAAQCGKG